MKERKPLPTYATYEQTNLNPYFVTYIGQNSLKPLTALSLYITVRMDHGRMNYKDTKPYMSAFLSVDLLTDFAAFCLTDFIDWRYIHSWFEFFDRACELLPPWKKEQLYFTCILLSLYCTFSLTFPPSPLSQSTVYTDSVWLGGGGWGVLKCTVDRILQEFCTLFLTRFRTY